MTRFLRAWVRHWTAATLVTSALVSACTRQQPAGRDASTKTAIAERGSVLTLTGVGATFPYPLYAQWFNRLAALRGIRIRYRADGSEAGMRALLDGTADFGASDRPQALQQNTGDRHFVWIPTVIGAVGLTYNVPGITAPLRLSSHVVADIYRGRITRWNDPALRAINPGLPLPNLPIAVVYRADGSGTAGVFLDYLRAEGPPWSTRRTDATAGAFPVGTAEAGNEGVAGRVKQTIGAIGFVEVVYARQNHLPVALLRNAQGNFVAPLPFEVASAAAGRPFATTQNTPLPASLVNAPGAYAYPIATYTWIVLEPARLSRDRLAALTDLLHWALTDGSDIVSQMGYVPLPSVTAALALDALHAMTIPSPVASP